MPHNTVPYVLVRSRRKTLSIQVMPDATVQVRAPLRMPLRTIEAFLREKAEWVARKQEEMNQRAAAAERLGAGEGEALFLGLKLAVQMTDAVRKPALRGETLLLPAAVDRNAALEGWYRAQARQMLRERVELCSARTGITPLSVSITGARHRWGSCSASGKLNFTWRLIMAPMSIVDAVVAHEMAHVLHHNHSQQFWQCVRSIQPDYEQCERWLRENQFILRQL